jgi:hypothetical protein
MKLSLRSWLLFILIAVLLYGGYQYVLLKKYDRNVQVSFPLVTKEYTLINDKQIITLLSTEGVDAEHKKAITEIHTSLSEMNTASDTRKKIAHLIDAQKTAFTLFTESGSTLAQNEAYIDWRRQFSQLGKVFPKLINYNQDATIFNHLLHSFPIQILGWILRTKDYPIIDVNGSVYHAEIII